MKIAPRMILATAVALAVTHAQFSSGRAAGPPGGGGGGNDEEPWSLFSPGDGEVYSQHPGYMGGGPISGEAGLYNFQHASTDPTGVFMSELSLLTFDGITVVEENTWVRPPENESGSLFTMLVPFDIEFEFPSNSGGEFPGQGDEMDLTLLCTFAGVNYAQYYVEMPY